MSTGATGRPRVFGVLMTRNEVDILRLNVAFHAKNHCERILVVDNGSSDRSRTVLKRLARQFAVDWTSDPGAMHQSEIVTGLAHEARGKGADWVIPLDTDEFWHAAEPLPDVLAGYPGAGAVEVKRIEYVQSRSQTRTNTRAVLSATMRFERPLLGKQAIDEFLARERSMFEVEPAPKVAVRTGPDVVIERGGHVATGTTGPLEVAQDVAIFHVPMRSRKALWKRAEQGRRVSELSADPYVGWQNRYWQGLLEDGLLAEGWAAHSFEDGALDVFGRRVELTEDSRLAEILAPLVRSRFKQLAARATGRPW